MNFEDFIKEYNLNYEFVKLKYQQGKSYKEIAYQYKFSTSYIVQKCDTFICALYKLYIQYLENLQIEVESWDIYSFYQSKVLSVSYLEKAYMEHLNLLRQGIPPLILGYSSDIPPFRKLTDEILLDLEKKIVDEKNNTNRTFLT